MLSNRRPAAVKLPPFSSLLPRTPSPPPTPVTPTFPFRVGTPSTCARSPLSACFLFSPISPTSYSGSPRPVIPPIGSLSLSVHGAGHPRGGISKASRRRGPGSPTINRADTVKYRRPEEKPPQRAGRIKSNFPLTVKIQCKWKKKGEEDCTWTRWALDHAEWSEHLNDHFASSETLKDGLVRCRWGECKKREGKSSWLNHIRWHDPNFWVFCKCGQRVVTLKNLKKHHRRKLLTCAGKGWGRAQGMNDRDGDTIEERSGGLSSKASGS